MNPHPSTPKKEIYRQLGPPLPIQMREPVTCKSLYDFITEQPDEIKDNVKPIEELSKETEGYIGRHKKIHQIGISIGVLFQNYLYKNHEHLSIHNDLSFASCKIDIGCKLNPVTPLSKKQQNVLMFESRFQSGNLALAACSREDRNYYLALQRDINSDSPTTQWFYFRVSNRHNTGVYTFHIVNYVKPYSMFNAGMKPCVFSTKTGRSWKRDGFAIEYRRNSLAINEFQNYYSLSFSYNFSEVDDEVYFAYCYPYTYTRLQTFLNTIEPKHTDKLRRKVITKTLGGNNVEMVSITSPQYLNKKTIIITARVHPGETVASFTCEAIITFLLSNHPDAEKLRNQFIIKIVPMLNPDGVINGNYRTSLSGDDLNRQWKSPSKTNHPQIYILKKIIIESEYKKVLYIDIHGHSKKKASFMYGCVSQKSPYVPKELPYVLSKKMQHFNYYNCNFTVSKSKQGTSRITLWKAGIENSYTYEISFCGPQRQKRHFNIKDYETLGIELCKTLSTYFYSRILNLQVNQEINKRCQQFYDDDQLMNLGNEETHGSSSQLQDQMDKQEIVMNLTSKKLLSRNHNSTERSESNRLNELLNGYISKYRGQVRRPNNNLVDQSKELLKEKDQSFEKDLLFRNRQSLMLTKVNIQKMVANDMIFPSMSTYYGFAAEKNHVPFLEQRKAESLGRSFEGQLSGQRQAQSSEAFGVLLPNVQKGQYKKYERYKKDKPIVGDRSLSVYVQNLMQNCQANTTVKSKMNSSNYFVRNDREMSLAQHMRSRPNDRRDTKF